MAKPEALSAGNKKIKQVQSWQRSSKDRREAGIFIAEGIKMFREAPEGWIREVYMTPEVYEEICDADRASFGNTGVDGSKLLDKIDYPCYLVDSSVFSKMSDTQTPQGVLTVMKRPEYTLEGMLGNDKKPLLLILENLQDPGNLGTILRVGEAAGVTGIIMTKGTVDIFNPKVVRSTMGSMYRMPFIYTDELPAVLEILKGKGVLTYAAHLKGSEIFTDYDYRQPTAFFIGNEGNGLTDETTALADKRLLIPMEGSVESLNAGVATAVLVYEAHRQRRMTE